jgi:hypothetical protein
MKLFGIISFTLVLLIGASISAMDVGKIAAVEPRAEAENIVVPVELNNNIEMTALELPLAFSDGATLVGVSFEGTRSQDFDLKVAKIDNAAHTVVIALIPMVYGENSNLAPGNGVIANLEFSIDDPNLETIEITPTSMENPSHDLMFIYLDDSKNLVDEQPEFGDITVALSEITGVDPALPTKFELHQNAPNPFNPITGINYDLPKASFVRLEVFNILGQNVKTLVDDYQEAGFQSITWDGTNNNNTPVASGMYFYRIEADDFQATKKMMMLK